tara:strand:+ start:88 stop:363 length:276 start_codon:yes stop_codon:yes gene_type:complete
MKGYNNMDNKYFIIEITKWSYGNGYTIAKDKMFDNLSDASKFCVALENIQSLNKNGCDKIYHIQKVDKSIYTDEKPLLLTKEMELSNDRSN